MNAIERTSNAPESAAPVQLLGMPCCPECCSDEDCASGETPCC